MYIETQGQDLISLINLYNQEIDILKSKLLNGVPWEELIHFRKNITELAIAIHKSAGCKVPDKRTDAAASFKSCSLNK